MLIRALIAILLFPLIASAQINDRFVGLDTLLLKECKILRPNVLEAARDSIAEVKYIRYPSTATDTSALLSQLNTEVLEWVQIHAEAA